jgi:hypothetical protein
MKSPTTSKIDYLVFGLLSLLVVVLWSLHPELETIFIDPADTESYADFRSHVGHRWIFVAVVKAFTGFGLSLHKTGICMNVFALFYLVWLLWRYLSDLEISIQPSFVLLACISSPLFLLQKNILSTDLFSGLLIFHAFVLFEAQRKCSDETVRFRQFWFPALLLILAQNVKVTALLVCMAYGLVIPLEEPAKRPKTLKMILCVSCWAAGFFLLELYATQLIFGDPFFRITETLRKPKGGNAPNELPGAARSVPVPLVFYHIFSHVKTVGRYGVPGLLSLVGLWIFRRITVARIYFALLVLFSLLGTWGTLTMERYWLTCLPFQMVLYILLLQKLGGDPRRHHRAFAHALICFAISVSLANYFFRFYPSILALVGERILGT